MSDRRTTFTKEEKVLLQKLHRGQWTWDELAWLSRHLPSDTPARLQGEVNFYLLNHPRGPHDTHEEERRLHGC